MLAAVRLVAFLVASVCTFAGWYDHAWALYGPVAAVAWAVFAAAVALHRGPYFLEPRIGAMAATHDEDAARMQGRWEALPDDGADFLDPGGAPWLAELQVFGRCSLYQLLSRAALPAGRARLAAALREGVEVSALVERQQAAAELARLSGLRRRVQVEGRLVRVDEAALERFFAWAEADVDPRWLRPVEVFGALLVVATFVQGVLSASFDLPTAWRVTLALQVVVYLATTRRLSADYAPLLGDARHRPFVALRRMFARIEARRFRSALLQRMQAELGPEGARPSQRMATFEAVLEALASVGGFAADHPDYAWPVVAPAEAGEPVFAGQAVGHPLFAAATRRANDFTIEHGGELVLITGSNMSGKSSFLRTVGINTLLARAGTPACARALRMVPCDLSTSIQVTDAPAQGLSRFYAEVKRIRGVIERVEAAERDPDEVPCLYLIDEMLSGTNSRERNLACRTIVRRLVGARRSFGLVTTHDLDLVGVADELPADVICYHFSDRFDGTHLDFDYRLMPGVATTTNALHVLAMEGIEVGADPEVP